MATPWNRTVRRFALMAAAGTLLTPAAWASGASEQIESAAQRLRDGQTVTARQELLRLDRDAMTPAERERVIELLAAAERRLRHADPVAVSLEKADLALSEGDVREARRHASAARGHGKASDAQRAAAAGLLSRSDALAAELTPLASPAMEQAERDFGAGRYAEAKAGLDSVHRSGVELSAEQVRLLEGYRARIVELERSRGEVFTSAYTPLAALQPGRVERTSDPRPDRGAGEPVAQSQPAEPAASGSVVAESAPSQPGTQDDLIREAMRFDAQRYLAEADASFEAGRFGEAEQKYALIAGTYRGYVTPEEAARADRRLEEARISLSEPTGRLLETVGQSRALIREQAVAESENLVGQARQSLQRGAFEEARNRAARARLTVAQAREVFSEEEYNGRIRDVDALVRQINDEEESARVREIERRAEEVGRAEADAERRQRADRERKIVEALDRIRQLQVEQKYAEALQVVDQVLFLDPVNPAGLLLRDVLRDVVIYREWNDIQREKAFSYAVEENEMQRGTIMPQDLVSYPSDWPEISFRRGETVAFVDTEEDRRVLADLETRRIPASFSAHRFEDVLNFIATVTNLNVDVNWDSLSNIGIERDTEVTLNLRAVPVRVVLERVLDKVSRDQFSRAGWAVEDGVLVVAADESLRRRTFIKIYDVQDLVFRVPDFPNVPELDLDTILQQGSQRGGGGGGGGVFQSEEVDNVDQILEDERATLDRIIELIQQNVDFEGWRDNGGETGFIQELNGNLIITNTARNHREIVGLLRQLREVRAIQISVESRFLEVSQDFFEQIGFDLDVYFNAQNNQYDDVRRQENAQRAVNDPFLPPDATPTTPRDLAPFVGNGRRRTVSNQQWIFDEEDTTTGEVSFAFDQAPTAITAPDPLSIIPVEQNSNNIAESLIGGSFSQAILASNPALGIAGTFLDDVQVDLLVTATQADRRNVTLTAPRLTFVNGRFANIFVANQQSFVSDLTPIVGTSAVAFDPTVSPLTTGVTLLLRGVVSADRRYVTMMIQSRVATLVSLENELEIQAATGGQGNAGGGATATGVVQLPQISISAVSTGVTVPDQGTILLGGQRLVTESEVEVGVPVLSKIPILNRFFTNRLETKEERTLLILLKPTILIQNEEEEKNFPGLLDRLGGGLGG